MNGIFSRKKCSGKREIRVLTRDIDVSGSADTGKNLAQQAKPSNIEETTAANGFALFIV